MNPLIDQSLLDNAGDIQQNQFPVAQQVNPDEYFKAAQNLLAAQVNQRKQAMQYEASPGIFANNPSGDIDRGNYFASRDIGNQQVSLLEKQFAAMPKPTAGQLNPVDFSSMPLTNDPASQFARLQKVGALNMVLNPQQLQAFRQHQDSSLQNKIAAQSATNLGSKQRAFIQPTALQGSVPQAITGESLIKNPNFLALAQSDPTKAHQIFMAATGQDLQAVQKDLWDKQETVAKAGAAQILELAKNNRFQLGKDGSIVAGVEDPRMKGMVQWVSPTGKGNGSDPRNPAPMDATTTQMFHLGTKHLGIAPTAEQILQFQKDQQKGVPPTSPADKLERVVRNIGASPASIGTPLRSGGQNPDWNGDSKTSVPTVDNNTWNMGVDQYAQTSGAIGSQVVNPIANALARIGTPEGRIQNQNILMSRLQQGSQAVTNFFNRPYNYLTGNNLQGATPSQDSSRSLTPEQFAILQKRKH